jgi:hypothetical protein
VLEVLHTSPLLNKLEVYAGMDVSEVWTFKDGRFQLYALDRAAHRYVAIERSTLVPGLDFSAVARFAVRSDTPAALREFEQLVRSR